MRRTWIYRHVTLHEYTCTYTLRWQGQISLRVPRSVALLNDSCALKCKKKKIFKWRQLHCVENRFHILLFYINGDVGVTFSDEWYKNESSFRLIDYCTFYLYLILWKGRGVGGYEKSLALRHKRKWREQGKKEKNKKQKQLNPGPGSWKKKN